MSIICGSMPLPDAYASFIKKIVLKVGRSELLGNAYNI
jgi:hypothetical protein